MIDIHAHLLPGIDDGARSMPDALAIARACVADGITHMVMTPHVYPGVFDNAATGIAQVYEVFRAALAVEEIPLCISFSAEVRLTPEVMPMLVEGQVPFLGRSDGYDNMLLELPDGQVPVGARNFVDWLLSRNIRPVIVHPERNKGVMEKPEKLRAFIDAGCLLQLTAGSVVGRFGTRAQEVCDLILEEGWASVVASDTHNLGARKPMMTAARASIAKRYGRDAALSLTQFTPAALCNVDSGADSGWRLD